MRLRMAAAALAALMVATPALAQLPAMRDRPLSAAERGRLTELEGQLQRISAQRNTSAAAVRSIARKLGSRLTTASTDDILKLVDEKAGELATAKGRIAELESQLDTLDSMRLARAVQPLLEAAQTAIDEGELDIAEAKLAEAASQFGEARQTLQGRVDDLSLREAAIVVQQAQVRRAGFDYLGASELYGRAGDLATSDTDARIRAYYFQAENLSLHGTHTVDAAALAEALDVMRDKVIPLTTPQSPGFYRGAREGYAGMLAGQTALNSTGEGRREIVRMRQEVLASYDRAAEPEEWGRQRMNLASAEAELGKMQADRAGLTAAIQGFAEAEPLIVDPEIRLRTFHAWASALMYLGHTFGDSEQSRAAAALFARGLSETPAEQTLLRGYMLDGLASSEIDAGVAEGDLSTVRAGVGHSRESLEVVSMAESPMSRAGFGLTLAKGLQAAARLSGSEALGDIAAAREALVEPGQTFSRDQAPVDWIWVEMELAGLDVLEGRLRGSADLARSARQRYRAIQAAAETQMPATWIDGRSGEAHALALEADLAEGAARRDLRTQAAAAWSDAAVRATALGLDPTVHAARAAEARAALAS